MESSPGQPIRQPPIQAAFRERGMPAEVQQEASGSSKQALAQAATVRATGYWRLPPGAVWLTSINTPSRIASARV
jgi:hypothetical protein